MFGLGTDAVVGRIPQETSPNARAVRVPVGQIANGACELSAWCRAGMVAPNEDGDIRNELGGNSYEGRSGAMACEVVFVLSFGVAELASA